jgi:hypothetical protein
MQGFSKRWHARGSVAINVNNDAWPSDQKFLRQDDHLSPMLFNIMASMLAIMNECANVDGQIKGVIPHLVDGGLSILHYADVIFFL